MVVSLDGLRRWVLAPLRLLFPSRVFTNLLLSDTPDMLGALIPLFYQGAIPDADTLAVAGQYEFVLILLEVAEDGVVNGLYSLVGQHWEADRPRALEALKLCLALLLLLGALLTTTVQIFTRQFIDVISTPESIAASTEQLLRISSFSFPTTLMTRGLLATIFLSRSSAVIPLRAFNLAATFFINFFAFGADQPWPTLGWGRDHLGLVVLITSAVHAAAALLTLCWVQRTTPLHLLFAVPFFARLRPNLVAFLRVGWGTFGETAIEHFFYFAVTLTFVNRLGEVEIGAFYVLTNIVWSLLIVPSQAVTNYVKVQVGVTPPDRGEYRRILRKAAVTNSAWLLVVGALGTGFWPVLAAFFSSSDERVAAESGRMFLQFGWAYALYTFTMLLDGFCFGTGHTKFIFLRSLATGTTVSLAPLLLYHAGLLDPTWYWVLGISGVQYGVQLALSALFYTRLWSQLFAAQVQPTEAPSLAPTQETDTKAPSAESSAERDRP